MLGDGDEEIEIEYSEEICFALGRLEQPSQYKNLLYRHDKPYESTKKGTLSFVLFESPFTSISTVSRDHPSLVTLGVETVGAGSKYSVFISFWLNENKIYKSVLFCISPF